MKVLMVNIGFLPSVSWGGPVQSVYHLSRALIRRGLQVRVCASDHLDKATRISPDQAEGTVKGIPVVYLKSFFVKRWPGTVGPVLLAPSALLRLWREVAQSELVHAHGYRNSIVISAVLMAGLQRKPVVLQPRGSIPYGQDSVFLKRLFDRCFKRVTFRGVRAFIALQATERQQLLQAGADPGRVYTVPNGLETRRGGHHVPAGDVRGRFGISPRKQIVLFVGRLHPIKGVDLLVEAYSLLPEPLRSGCVLVVAGPDDGHLKQIHSLIERAGLSKNVVLTGGLSREAIDDLFSEADVFVLPSRRDAFPMSLLEACRAGVPMIVSDACAIADSISGQAGDVVPLDPQAFADALQSLLRDDTRRTRYAQRGRELAAEMFAVDNVSRKMERVYRKAVASRPKAG